MSKILVTPRSVTAAGHPSLDRLREAGHELVFCTAGKMPDEEELLRLLPGCAGYLAGVEPVTARALEAAGDLTVISRNGTGIDNIDLAAAERRGIAVCRALGANARGVAELVVGLLFGLARSVPFSDRQLKSGEWQRRRGIELSGRTLGLVGCGQIGRIVAELGLGLGMDVRAYDVKPDEAFAPSPRFRFASFDEVLGGADFLSLHCPTPPDGKPILAAPQFAKMKPGAYLINTARAGLVDAASLLDKLDDGHLAGAAVDVYEIEPPCRDPLVVHDRVIATPHIGAFTAESVDRAMQAAVSSLLEHLP